MDEFVKTELISDSEGKLENSKQHFQVVNVIRAACLQRIRN